MEEITRCREGGVEGTDYDSRQDVEEHRARVREIFFPILTNLIYRIAEHDSSKLDSPEKEIFDRFPISKMLKYGTKEYEKVLRDMGEALSHHYKKNRHHPEYYDDGINGMSLLDILEMFVDWKASSQHRGGDFGDSLRIGKDRFKMSEQLYRILLNTEKELFN